MRVLTVFLLFSLLPLTAQTSGEKGAVAAVQRLFDAMASHDGAAIQSAMLTDARLYSVRGEDAPAMSSVMDFVNRINGMSGGVLERFTGAPRVEIRGRIAQVWGEYAFLRDGKLDHCGIDSVTLLGTAAGWKIASLSFTSEACH